LLDSPLEEDGRELVVPPRRERLWAATPGKHCGGSNEAGGNLILSSGVTTGTGTSNIQFNTYPAGSSGTSDNTALTGLTLSASGTNGSNANTTLQANNGSGTNQNGGTLTLSTGGSTGTGTTAMYFNVYPSGSSGSTANSAVTALSVVGNDSPSACLNGCVGIHTKTPANPFELDQTTTNDAGAGAMIVATTGANIRLWDDGSNARISGDFAEGTNILLNGGGTGFVGIGTTSPGQELEVNGKVKVDSFASASATTVCENSNVLSSCSSSIRYKKNVKPAPFGLNEVMEMRPITFKWKDRDEQDFGLIAEDVEKINPLFVTYARGQIEGVKYEQLTAVLINAVQEQQAEIEALRDEVARLEHKQ
jgi:hypothetical protein